MTDFFAAAHCLCLASRRAARTITRSFDRALRPHGIRATQFSVLAILTLKGPQTVGALAELLASERTTVSRNLDVAEAAGLVESGPGADARARLVSITPAGARIFEAAFATWQKVQAELAAQIGPEAAEGLRRLSGGPSLYQLQQKDPS